MIACKIERENKEVVEEWMDWEDSNTEKDEPNLETIV